MIVIKKWNVTQIKRLFSFLYWYCVGWDNPGWVAGITSQKSQWLHAVQVSFLLIIGIISGQCIWKRSGEHRASDLHHSYSVSQAHPASIRNVGLALESVKRGKITNKKLELKDFHSKWPAPSVSFTEASQIAMLNFVDPRKCNPIPTWNIFVNRPQEVHRYYANFCVKTRKEV